MSALSRTMRTELRAGARRASLAEVEELRVSEGLPQTSGRILSLAVMA